MHTLRTRFARDIVAEFLPPASYWRRKKGKQYKDKIVILCGGMPGIPSAKSTIEFLSRKGYWVFHPRYKGSWESNGIFLARSPHRDIADVVNSVCKGVVTNLWEKTKLKIAPAQVLLIGSSFGGPAALLNASDKRISYVIVFSPVIDWRVESKIEPIQRLTRFTRDAFGMAYRMHPSAWKKIQSGTYYNPMYDVRTIPGKKVMMVHAKDDEIVHWKPAVKFTAITGAKLFLDARGGHMGLSTIMKPKQWMRIEKFFHS